MKINFQQKHPIILLNYFPRICGDLFMCIVSLSVLLAQDRLTLFTGIFLFCIGLVWPNLALYLSYNSSHPKYIEMNFIYVDGFLIGLLIALINLALWPTVGFVMCIMVGSLSLNGIRMWALTMFVVSCGIVTMFLLHGVDLHYATDPRTTLLSMLGMFSFTFVTGYMTFLRNQSGKKTRTHLIAALNELEHINKVLHASSSSLRLDNVTRILIDSLRKNVFNFDTLTVQIFDVESNQLVYKLVDDQLISPGSYDSLRAVKIDFNATSQAMDVLKTNKICYIKELQFTECEPVDREILSLVMSCSVIMFPLLIKNKAIGVISFYSRKPMILSQLQIETVDNYIKQVSLIINNTILHDQVRNKRLEISEKNKQLKSISVHLAKYIPPQLFDKIMNGEVDIHVGAQKKLLTIFFSDIVSFTELSDRLDSDVLTKMLNIYLDSMTKIALKHGGTIDKYIGDAIMIFFGDPNTSGVKEDANKCAMMALEMKQKLSELKSHWRDLGIPDDLQVRMGIHTGYCAVGNFGSEFRMDYTIIGSAVNLASRLMTSGAPGEIITSNETSLLICNLVHCEENGMVRAKGFAQPIKTFKILGSSAVSANTALEQH